MAACSAISCRSSGAISPRGGVAEALITATRTGVVVDATANAIADGIERLWRDWRRGFPNWAPEWSLIRDQTRKRACQRLAETLADCVDATS